MGMAQGFGPHVKYDISQQVSRMRQDLDVMDQNFSAMSPSAQATDSPNGLEGPLMSATAKENIQRDINKWQPLGLD